MLINYSFPCKDIGKQDKTARSLTGASDAGAYNYTFKQALIALYHLHFPNNARNWVNLVIALIDGSINVPVSNVSGGGQGGKYFSNQSGIKMFVCQVRLFV